MSYDGKSCEEYGRGDTFKKPSKIKAFCGKKRHKKRATGGIRIRDLVITNDALVPAELQ